MSLNQATFFLKVFYLLIEFPQILLTFLVVPPATHALDGLETRVRKAGFRILDYKDFLGTYVMDRFQCSEEEVLGGIGVGEQLHWGGS